MISWCIYCAFCQSQVFDGSF